MTTALETTDLERRYGRTAALDGCTLSIPAGRVAALVGPNGAGKTTLLHCAVGLLTPTGGSIRVLDSELRGGDSDLRERIGFVAQDAPLYRAFSVTDMLRLGERLNSRWDRDLAHQRLRDLDIPLDRPCGKLSGGQRAQVALTLALAKRPEVLFLDEPVASLDPLARREFLEGLMEAVEEHGISVVLSSHLIADLERVCDYLVLLCDGRVQLAGDVDALVAEHRLLSGPRVAPESLVRGDTVIEERHTERQSTILVRGSAPLVDPRYDVTTLGLEDLVLAYLRRRRTAASRSFRALEISA